MSEVKRAVICINCKRTYGCQQASTKTYCKDCSLVKLCTIICVEDVSGGACASCLDTYKEKRRAKKDVPKEVT